MKPAWNPGKAERQRRENDAVNANLRSARELRRLLARIAETAALSREQLRTRLVANAERRARADEERRRLLNAEIAKRKNLAKRERRFSPPG